MCRPRPGCVAASCWLSLSARCLVGVHAQGATESNNLAIKGVAKFYREQKNHVITTQTVCGHGWVCLLNKPTYTLPCGRMCPPSVWPNVSLFRVCFRACVQEHKCVLDSCRWLELNGFEVTYLPVKTNGLIDLAALEAAIRCVTPVCVPVA